MISAIRTGVPAVAIVPGIFSALDRYRRDGSLFCLPLVGDKNEKLPIEILYAFKSNEPKRTRTAKAAVFDVEDFRRMTLAKSKGADQQDNCPQRMELVGQFLEHLQTMLKTRLFEVTGWNLDGPTQKDDQTDVDERLLHAYKDLPEFRHCYHVTSPRIGMDVPRWVYSAIDLKEEATEPDSPIRRVVYEGKTYTYHPDRSQMDKPDIYKLKCRMVGNQVISFRGHRLDPLGERTDADSFVASLYMLARGGRCVMGVWSGRDATGRTPLTAPFVLSRDPLEPDEVREASYAIMLRTLTDVRALPDCPPVKAIPSIGVNEKA
jgi:hypothetical protein